MPIKSVYTVLLTLLLYPPVLAMDADKPAKDFRIFSAVFAGNPVELKKLIAARVDLNTQNSTGETALFFAVNHRNKKLAHLLIKAGADINIPNNDGSTALMWAIESGDSTLVKALINAGATVNIKNNYGITPLIWAARECSDALDNFNCLALSWAIPRSVPCISEALIAAGAQLDTNLRHYTDFAVAKSQLEKLFAAARVPFTPATNIDYTRNHPHEVAQLHTLIKLITMHPFRLNFVDAQGNTLLHNALLSGNRVTVVLLLYLMIKHEQGESLYYRNKQHGQTAVELAVAKGAGWLLQPFFETLCRYTHTSSNE